MKSIVVIVWALVICAGMGWLWEYSLRPGGKGQALPTWPVQASIAPIPGRYNLVLSLHPHCPCSSATAEELAGVLARTGEAMQVHVLLYKPHDAGDAWAQTLLTATVEKLPHTVINTDIDGAQAERFGALTSGDAQLFAPDGRLVFHGGITPSRGHVGDNAGSETIIAAVNGQPNSVHDTAVFGCAIQDHPGGGERR